MTTDRSVLARRRQHAEEQRRAFLDALDRQQLEQRVRSLAADGVSERDTAELLGLHVEQVRQIIGERTEQRA